MKIIYTAAAIILSLSSCEGKDPKENDPIRTIDRSYHFDNGVIPRNVLESYLSRSITQAEFLVSEGFYNDGVYPYQEDDTRLLKNIGAKFVGRAIYSWNVPEHFNRPEFLGQAVERIDQMHEFDPDIVFQAAIFEIVSTKVNTVPVPPWVFEKFDLPVEARNFAYENMLNPQGLFVNHWGAGASVPDISQRETRMFFYYMARRYMEIGIEAIHFGQAELMAMTDRNNDYAGWRDLLDKVRTTALTKARRGTVLCDAHLSGGGLAVDGKLLFDFVSFPLRLKEIPGDPKKAELKKFYLDAIYGRTIGGITPSGWSCDNSLYQVEFDNFGISDHPGIHNLNDHFVWGYDEISWFSDQPEDYRNEFLTYADDWVRKVDPNGFLQMPGSRVISGMVGNRYRANNKGEACPIGKSQEETIKEIWSK